MTWPIDPNGPDSPARSEQLRREFLQLVPGQPAPVGGVDHCTVIVHHTGVGTTMVLAPNDALEAERREVFPS